MNNHKDKFFLLLNITIYCIINMLSLLLLKGDIKEIFMKRLIVSIVIISYFVFLSGCKNNSEIKRWSCEFTILENSDEIILSETVLHTNTGKLCVQNRTKLDIKLYLFDNKEMTHPVHELYIPVGGACDMYQLDKETDYYVGVQANSTTTTEATIIISEEIISEPY